MRHHDLTLPRNVAAHFDDRADDLAAGGFNDEIDRAPSGFLGRVRIDSALVTVGGIGSEPEAFRGRTDRLAFENRRFEHEIDGVGRDA